MVAYISNGKTCPLALTLSTPVRLNHGGGGIRSLSNRAIVILLCAV